MLNAERAFVRHSASVNRLRHRRHQAAEGRHRAFHARRRPSTSHRRLPHRTTYGGECAAPGHFEATTAWSVPAPAASVRRESNSS